MDAIVCVKQIPDPEAPPAAFKVDEANMEVIPAPGVQPVISPFDAQAVEAALQLRDAAGGDGAINILSLGPDSARDAIKHGLAMGADEGYQLNDPAFAGGDAWTTALALSKAIDKIGLPGLLLFGRQAADLDQGTVGSIVAELLDLPSATVLRSVALDGDRINVSRVVADGFENISMPMPSVLTISNEFGDPRYPQLRQIMRAAKKQVTVWTPADLGLDPAQVGAAGARVKMEALFQPQNDTACEFIEADTAEEKATILAQKLREAKLI
ncbi:MAG: electron transfer flavoprotein subunit beta/FixA family protein [Dehalococcoidia bacterium]